MTESLICLPSVPLEAESAKAKFQLLLALVMGFAAQRQTNRLQS
jgi:hypothetical protein